MTEIIHPYDPRSHHFEIPLKREMDGLTEKTAWKIVPQDETPYNSSISRGGFVLAVKHEGKEIEKWKTGFVVQRHRDKCKNVMIHDITLARKHSIELLDGLASIFSTCLFSSDVTSGLYTKKRFVAEEYIC